MEDSKLSKIASEYGSPCFVFDADELVNRVNSIRELLMSVRSDSENQIDLCYAVKANPFLISVLEDLVDKFEVCSPGELEIVKYYSVSSSKIVYSGVNKGEKDIKEALDYGVSIITAESIRHFELIMKEAGKRDNEVRVILRLTSGNQFGMSVNDIRSILDKMPYKNIRIDGIHYYAATQRNNPKPQEKELKKLEEILDELRQKYCIKLRKLEYGPGLPYPYFDKDDFSDTLAPLKNILPALAQTSKVCELTIEVGRFIASSCGYYLTSICDIKESEGQKWCILDGGLNHINYYGQMMGMKKPIIRHFSGGSQVQEDNDKTAYALCGSLCTSNDILVRNYELGKPKIGDILAFENIGAYSVTEGIALFLSRDMAKVIIHSNGANCLIRDSINSWKINCRESTIS